VDKTENYFEDMYHNWKGRRFSDRPRRHIIRIPKLQRNEIGLTALEIGSGEAQNLIYLAKKGYSCTATDFSKEALLRAKRYANEAKVKISAKKLDIRNQKIGGKYDTIILTLVLHNIEEKDRLRVISKIMLATKRKGLNFISFYTEREGKQEFRGLEDKITLKYQKSKWKILFKQNDSGKLQNGKRCKITTIIATNPKI
jgi:2-polyprenyl-3-methyl-5-hydroxy-6-metoxy-1,4-benzoquinol methylase